jgi:hypothetical protein
MGWTSRPPGPSRTASGDGTPVNAAKTITVPQGRAGRVAPGPITSGNQHVGDDLGCKIAPRLGGQAGPKFDAGHVSGEPGQQRSLPAGVGAGLQHLPAAGQAEPGAPPAMAGPPRLAWPAPQIGAPAYRPRTR